MKVSLKKLMLLVVVGTYVFAAAQSQIPTAFSVAGAAAQPKKVTYYKGLKPKYPVLKPKSFKKNACDPADTPFVLQPLSEVVKLNEQRIAAVAAYGAYMIENIRGKKTDGSLYRLYPGQDRLFAGNLLGKTMFALCDGHGKEGGKIAEKVLNTIPLKVLNSKNTEDGFVTACKSMQDTFIKNNQAYQSGTTFVAGVIQDKKLTIAHVGDSRLMVIRPRNTSIVFATEDHKATDTVYRTTGLALSRALGDVQVYQAGYTTVKPDVTQVDLLEGDYVILASDGYWDVYQNAETCTLIMQLLAAKKDCKQIAQQLAEAARARKSRDDISVLVVRYGALTQGDRGSNK